MDAYEPVRMLKGLLDLPVLRRMQLGPVRMGAGSLVENAVKAEVELPDRRIYRAYRIILDRRPAEPIEPMNSDMETSQYIRKRNLVAVVHSEGEEDLGSEDSLYVEKGTIGAYVHTESIPDHNQQNGKCGYDVNKPAGSRGSYILLRTEPCYPDEPVNTVILSDGTKVRYYGGSERVIL